jgi:HEAT repeat protein
MDDAITALIAQLDAPDPAVRFVAADTLAQRCTDDLVHYLTQEAQSRRARGSVCAVILLWAGHDWIVEDVTDRQIVAHGLCQLGSEGFLRLLDHLHDPDYRVRDTAGMGLMIQETHIASPAIAALLKNPDADVRVAATAHLLEYHADPTLVPHVIQALADPDSVVRLNMMGWLKGNVVREAVPDLLPLLHDPVALVRAGALRTLCSIARSALVDDPQTRSEVRSAMIAALSDDHANVRLHAIQALSLANLLDTSVRPHLVVLVNDKDPLVREEAEEVINCVDLLAARDTLNQFGDQEPASE